MLCKFLLVVCVFFAGCTILMCVFLLHVLKTLKIYVYFNFLRFGNSLSRFLLLLMLYYIMLLLISAKNVLNLFYGNAIECIVSQMCKSIKVKIQNWFMWIFEHYFNDTKATKAKNINFNYKMFYNIFLRMLLIYAFVSLFILFSYFIFMVPSS